MKGAKEEAGSHVHQEVYIYTYIYMSESAQLGWVAEVALRRVSCVVDFPVICLICNKIPLWLTKVICLSIHCFETG